MPHSRHIFYDASGRRKRRLRRAMWAFGALVVLAVSLFVLSIIEVKPQPLLDFAVERPAMRA